MSTYYATFTDAREAQSLLHELLRSGVGPDDVSLIIGEVGEATRVSVEAPNTVGDATSFVGRFDDPLVDDRVLRGLELADRTSIPDSPIGGIDTSNIATDVDSVDQSDESQTYAEDSLWPPVPVVEGVADSESMVEDEMDDAVVAISVPGVGIIAGGGALATAALEFDRAESIESLRKFLLESGLTVDRAEDYCRAYRLGNPLLGVEVTPGALNEGQLERYVERHHPVEAELFDAPRFTDASRVDARLM